VRHAILGAGGIGGFVGGALARSGREVLLLLRPETLARYPARLRVESTRLGDFEVDVATAAALDRQVDVLWVTPKATQLASAVELAPADRVGEAVVVPLLNGIDHVALLRDRYEQVLPGAIWVESERVESGRIVEKTEMARVDLAPGGRHDEIAEDLRAAGLDVVQAADESTLLWGKLAILAPLALTTTALGAPVGAVQADPAWYRRLLECHDEAVKIGLAEGAALDPAQLRHVYEVPHGELRTSMQKDFDAGRPLELDAIAGPVARGGRRHGIPTPATEELVSLVEARLAARPT
jgi:2-dehydropantoate 2-reductase